MGLFGWLTGFDRHKEALNILNAQHFLENCVASQRKAVAQRIAFIQAKTLGRSAGSNEDIYRNISSKSREVQLQFVAVACGNIPFEPLTRGQFFFPVQNPHHADGLASQNLEMGAGVIRKQNMDFTFEWPGPNAGYDFSQMAATGELAETLLINGKSVPKEPPKWVGGSVQSGAVQPEMPVKATFTHAEQTAKHVAPEPLPPLRPLGSPSLIADTYGLDAAKKALRRFKEQDTILDASIDEACSAVYALEAGFNKIWNTSTDQYEVVDRLGQLMERAAIALKRMGQLAQLKRLDMSREQTQMMEAITIFLEDFRKKSDKWDSPFSIPIDSFVQTIEDPPSASFEAVDIYGLASALDNLKRFSGLSSNMKFAIDDVCKASAHLEDAVLNYSANIPRDEVLELFRSRTERFEVAMDAVKAAAALLGINVKLEQGLIKAALSTAVSAKGIKI